MYTEASTTTRFICTVMPQRQGKRQPCLLTLRFAGHLCDQRPGNSGQSPAAAAAVVAADAGTGGAAAAAAAACAAAAVAAVLQPPAAVAACQARQASLGPTCMHQCNVQVSSQLHPSACLNIYNITAPSISASSIGTCQRHGTLQELGI